MATTIDPFQCAERGDANYFEGVELDVIQNLRNEIGASVLTVAAKYGKLNCCEAIYRRCPQLLYARNNIGGTALHQATWNGFGKVVRFLITAKSKIDKEVKGSGNGGEEVAIDCELLLMVNANGSTALHDAAFEGKPQAAKVLIEADPNNIQLGMVTDEGQSPMHLAVGKHNLEIVKLFLEAAPNFEYRPNIHGQTVLILALYCAIKGEQGTAEIRRLLIEKQPAECTKTIGTKGWRILHHAAYIPDIIAISEVIHFWPDCWELVDNEGQNFLHLAAMHDKVEVVQYILGLPHVSDNVLNGKDIHGNTPLHIATSSGNHTLASILLDDPRVNKVSKNINGKNAFDLASGMLLEMLSRSNYPIQRAIEGDLEFFKEIQVNFFRKSRGEDGESVLSTAVRNGHLKCCEVIMERCPELLHQTNKNGVSTLHTASISGQIEIASFLLTARAKTEQMVENRRIDHQLLLMVSNNQSTALHFAVDNGHFMIAKLLIEANPTNELLKMTDNHKETAMHYAVKKHNFEIVKLLVEADPNFQYSADDSGDTPLSIALQEALSGNQIAVEIRNLLIQRQSSQCKVRTGRDGWTLLHVATSERDLSAIEEIIQFCPDCSGLVDKEGRNFLHLAVKLELENIVNYILDLADISDEVLNGKDINGDTPLHIATAKGNIAIALSLLYDSRVRKMIHNKKEKTALEAIKFDYDKRRAGVRGLIDIGDENELKDRSDFDLLVGALISTVAFTSGIAIPGGFISDGPYIGNAILYRKRTFEAFVVFNAIALALSLFAVFSHFCMKRLADEKDITHQLKVATFCSIGAIFAMMMAFIMGSFAVLSISLGLAITVCGICCCFFGFAFYSLWKIKGQKRRRRQA